MYTGTNGENWFQAEDPISRKWVLDLGDEFTLRFRADKPDFDPQDIPKLISLSDDFKVANKRLHVIYCANVKGPTDVEIQNIKTLTSAGVDIIAVEFGNETYSINQANFTFSVYKGWFEPLKNSISQLYPLMRMLVFMAPRPKSSGVLGGRTVHDTFNDEAIAYVNANDNIHPVVHIYMNEFECPILSTIPDPRVYDDTMFYRDLNDFYISLDNQTADTFTNLWDKTLDYLSNKMPGKRIYITEWGFDNYGTIKNTLGLGNFAWNVWVNYGNDPGIEALLQHNGLSLSLPGMISSRNKNVDITDNSGSNNLRRVDYWVYKLYKEIEGKTLVTSITEPGIIYALVGDSSFPVAPNLILTSKEERTINGKNIYSSSGFTEWMLKGSTPTYEINGISSIDYDSNSIGYVKFTVDEILAINEKPVAIITAPSTAYVGDKVTLNGSQSYDEDGTIVEYNWYDEFGKVVSTSTTYTFTQATPKSYSYLLVVTDDKGEKASESVIVEIKTKLVKHKPWYCSIFPWMKACKI